MPVIILAQSVLAVMSMVVAFAIFRRTILWPLTGFLVALSGHMLVNVLNEGYGITVPSITPLFSFLYGPLIYLFVSKLIYVEKDSLGWSVLLHFLPSILILPVRFFLPSFEQFGPFLALLSICVYFALSFRAIHRFHYVLHNTRSTDTDNLVWLRNLLLLMCIVGIFELARALLSSLSLQIPREVTYLLVNLSLLFFVCAIAIKAIQHIEFFEGISVQDAALSDSLQSQASATYAYTPNFDIAQALLDVKQAIEQQQLYLNSDVTLADVAKRVGYSPREVSIVINSQLQCNFSEFINSYRIDYACDLLTQDKLKENSVLEIMHRSGFNSKAAFYQAFKKRTGLTPNQYRKTIET